MTPGLVYAADYSSISAAIASLGKAGGRVVLGTGKFPAVTVPSNVTLQGQGREATWLAGVSIGSPSSLVTNAGLRDLGIDVTNAPAGTAALVVENAMRCIVEHIRLRSQDTVHDALRMVGSPTEATYYDTFRDIDITTSGFGIHFTGSGGINRHLFDRIIVMGHGGTALVDDTSGINNDTNEFRFLSAENMAAVAKLGLRFANNTFHNLTAENAGGASGAAHDNTFYRTQGVAFSLTGNGNHYL